MPKSRRGKGKHYHFSKKSKALRRQGMPGTAAAESPVAPGMPETPRPVSPTAAPTAMKVAAPAARVMASPDPYLLREIRRIAILVGIIVVVLVILSFVLS
jgi:hypothetical protein